MTEVKNTQEAPKLSDYSLDSDYKDNVKLWNIITDIPKSKRGALLLIGIKNTHKHIGDNIQRQLFQKHRPEVIEEDENDVQLISNFLDNHIGKPSKSLKFQCLHDIIEYCRKQGQEFAENAKHFEYLVAKAENAGLTTLSTDIKAGFLMNNANLTAQQIELLNSVVDLSNDDKLYDNVKSKKIKNPYQMLSWHNMKRQMQPGLNAKVSKRVNREIITKTHRVITKILKGEITKITGAVIIFLKTRGAIIFPKIKEGL